VRRSERRIFFREQVQLAANANEARVVRMLGVARRAFALLDDGVDRAKSGREVGDRDEAVERRDLRSDLRRGIAQKKSRFPDFFCERLKPCANTAIEMSDRCVILRARHEAITAPRALVLRSGLEPRTVRHVGPLGALATSTMADRQRATAAASSDEKSLDDALSE